MLMSCLSTFRQLSIRTSPAAGPFITGGHQRSIHVTQQNDAARKGTREKARKKKVKVEVKKIGFIPHNQRGKDK